MWAFYLFSKSYIGHVNHGNLKIYHGVGVSPTFSCSDAVFLLFFAVMRYSVSPPPMPPSMDSKLFFFEQNTL